jgi:cell division septation protein DedD
VSVKTGLTQAECSQFAFPDPKAQGAEPPSKAKLGSIEFVQAEEHTAEEAKQADAKYYHVFENGACYEFALGVGTVGEEGERGSMQVDRGEVFNKLEKILATVKIRPAEIPPTEGPVQTQAPAQPEKPAPAETPAPSAGSTLSSSSW